MRLAVLTTGRQDWGILRSTCELLHHDPKFDLRLIVGGMHCSRHFGQTETLLREAGFTPCERLAWVADEGPSAAHVQASEALQMVGDTLVRQAPEALLLVGDRFETAVAALAATLARVPVVHLHGGEETEGAFDNTLRHATTKLSHLHLVSHPEYARRVIAMGEDPRTVHVVGAPGLDNLHRTDLATRAELESHFGIPLRPPVVVVTLHPATLGCDPAEEVAAVRAAMDQVEATYVITLPNADPGNEPIRAALLDAVRVMSERRTAVEALGEKRYWGLMRLADVMLGNSSSALIEAPAIGLPAVNVGERQKGRLRGANVIDVPPDVESIAAALRTGLSVTFRHAARCALSPFGDGRSGEQIVEILSRWQPPTPPVKRGIKIIL